MITIVTNICEYILPSETFQKSIRGILAVVLIISIISSVIGSDYKFNLESIDNISELSVYNDMSKDIKSGYNDTLSNNLEKSLFDKLEENDIEVKKISIQAKLLEYTSIEIKSTEIYVDKDLMKEKEKLEKIKEITQKQIGNCTVLINEYDDENI